MKNVSLVLIACSALLMMSACTDTSSPEATVGSAATALQNDRLGDFKSTLSGSALDSFGNEAGMKILQAKLNGQKTKLSSPEYLGSPEDSQSEYALSVVTDDAAETVLADVTVNCQSRQTQCVYGSTVVIPCKVETVQDCTIDSIKI